MAGGQLPAAGAGERHDQQLPAPHRNSLRVPWRFPYRIPAGTRMGEVLGVKVPWPNPIPPTGWSRTHFDPESSVWIHTVSAVTPPVVYWEWKAPSDHPRLSRLD